MRKWVSHSNESFFYIKQSYRVGLALAFFAALLWGVSGALTQYLFNNRSFTPHWLVCFRLLAAGAVLLIASRLQGQASIWAPFQSKKDLVSLLIFSIFGMLAVQYTYFMSIGYSNAATATVIQYLGPLFIALYYSFAHRRWPDWKESLALAAAMMGAFLIVTHGNLQILSINGPVLAWGLASAVALAAYTILPIRLLKKFDAMTVVGWGMAIGGLFLLPFIQPFRVPGVWDTTALVFVALIVFFGTALAFISYLVAVKWIGAPAASLISCAEPLSAVILAVLWLEVPFGIYDWIGSFCILATITLLVIQKK